MAEPTNVELTQWLRSGALDAGAPETHKAWCEFAASKINSHADLVKALERLLAAFKGLQPFPLVVQAVAEGLIRDAEAALATLTARRVG